VPVSCGICTTGSCNATGQCASANFPTDYISYYKFENNANDETGRNNGTVIGATWTSSGKFGGAYNFNGNGKYISSTSNSLKIAGHYTISFWIKGNSNAGGAGGSEYQQPVRQGINGYNYQFNWIHGNDAYDKSCAFYDTGNVWRSSGSAPSTMTAGTWYNINCVWNGTRLSIYINGIEESYSNIGAVTPNTDNGILIIGANSTAETPFSGYIDELMIFNRSLSSAEVQQLYLRQN
jgi:hypothetical protein